MEERAHARGVGGRQRGQFAGEAVVQLGVDVSQALRKRGHALDRRVGDALQPDLVKVQRPRVRAPAELRGSSVAARAGARGKLFDTPRIVGVFQAAEVFGDLPRRTDDYVVGQIGSGGDDVLARGVVRVDLARDGAASGMNDRTDSVVCTHLGGCSNPGFHVVWWVHRFTR